jgi:N-acetylglucosamine-6-phosphate deacetylase
VHVHGAAGFDTMDEDGAALPAIAAFFARHGVTAFLATTWSAAHADTLAALQRIAHAVALPGTADGARIIGAHLEGPYLNPAYCGAQDARLIRRASLDEAAQYLGTGVIRLASLAPEFAENLAFLEVCVQRGITTSIAHTGASYAQARTAIARGLRHSTHTYNAMRGFSHREPGALGAVLTSPEVNCELIADGIHVHPAAMQLLAQAKGIERVILITDSMRATGMPEGQYAVDDRMVDVHDGSARLPDGTLAGSVLTMDAALRNFIAATGLALEQVWPASSLNAARAIQIDARKGSLAVGKDADLVWLDADLQVSMTMVEGRIVYRRQA